MSAEKCSQTHITLIDVNHFRQHDLHFPFLIFSVIFHQPFIVFFCWFSSSFVLFCFFFGKSNIYKSFESAITFLNAPFTIHFVSFHLFFCFVYLFLWDVVLTINDFSVQMNFQSARSSFSLRSFFFWFLCHFILKNKFVWIAFQ